MCVYPIPGIKGIEYSNLRVINNLNQLHGLDLDMIIFNNREAHHQFFGLSKSLHLPCLVIDHDISQHNDFILNQIRAQTPFQSISCSSPVQKQYHSLENINYGIEQIYGEYDKDIDILICGTFSDQDLFIINTLKKQFPTLRVFGQNPKLSYSEVADTYEDYKNLFKRAKVFLNLSVQSNISYEMLLALNSKCAIITNNFPVYRDLLNKDNAIILDNIEQVIPAIQNLINNKQAYQKYTSYKVDLSGYNSIEFIEKWKTVLESYRYKVYMP